MASPYNFGSENLFPGTTQGSTTPSIYAGIAFQETSVSFPCSGPDYSLSNFASGSDPLTSMPLLLDNYFSSSPPTMTQPQQDITARWAGNNITLDAAFNVTIDTNAIAMSYGNSPFIYPTEPSQSLKRVSTEPRRDIVQVFDAVNHQNEPPQLLRRASTEPHRGIAIVQELDCELFHPMSPTRSTTMHEDEPVECKWEGCTYFGTFSRDADLWRHIRTIHVHPDSFPCPVYSCGKSFGRNDKRQEHLRSHRRRTR